MQTRGRGARTEFETKFGEVGIVEVVELELLRRVLEFGVYSGLLDHAQLNLIVHTHHLFSQR